MKTSSIFKLIILSLMMSTLGACKNDNSDGDSPASSAEPINPQALQAAGFVTLLTTLPGFDDLQLPAKLVFRSAAEWQAAWLGSRQQGEASIPAPDVDFDKYMVAGLATLASNGCEATGISRVEQSATAITVHSWVSEPPPADAACTANVSRISQFVLLPKSSLPVQFVEHPLATAFPAWRLQLPVQATVYEDRTAKTGGSTACTPLVTTFAVRGGAGLPQQFRVNAVAVAQYGVTRWLQPASASETGVAQHTITDSNWLYDVPAGTAGSKSEPVLRGVARGCTSPQFKIDQPVTVLLSVAAADGQVELAANASLDAAAAVTH